MTFNFDGRPSDSPYVEWIWRTQSESAGSITSVAACHSEIVVTRHHGKTTVTVRGPETKATPADYPADAEFFGIVLKLGAFMPQLPARNLIDRRDAHLPEATGQSFWLHGSAWQYPDFENADTFVDRLVREGLLVYDPVVDAVLQDRPHELSIRTVRRHFLQATGLTPSEICQIERARYAMTLLRQGKSILDTVYEAGYFDQPHLTRSLKHFVGQTPAQIAGMNGAYQTSLVVSQLDGAKNEAPELANRTLPDPTP
jgi:AraC-like DNA-binding protein